MRRAKTPEEPEELTTQRIEAFSDGVFAIAITLLILEIKIPHLNTLHGAGGLASELRALWPSYFAYILSFIIIGIYWANHHYVFRLYRRTDHVFNLLNVFFLMCISFLPFPTAILGEFMRNPSNQHTAVTFYGVGLLLPAFGWFLLWLYASHRYRLLDKNLDEGFVRALTRQYLLSIFLYITALLVSFWNTFASLAISTGLTLLYLLPPKKPVYRQSQSK